MKTILSLCLVGWWFAVPMQVLGYLVGPPVNLDKLEAEADVIVKGTTLSSASVTDEGFRSLPGFECRETTFRVVSVFKGKLAADEVKFRYYSFSLSNGVFMSFSPQHYAFKPGQSYVLFAKHSSAKNRLQQIWMDQKGKEDQGALLCATDQPPKASALKEWILAELTSLLADKNPENVAYGIRQLDSMSGSADAKERDFYRTSDFDRGEVLKLLLPLLNHPDAKVTAATQALIGSDNPYMSDQEAEFWLATVGSADIPGLSKRDKNKRNSGGELYWKQLCEIADKPGPPESRGLAIRSLGLVKRPELLPHIDQWLKDDAPEVRAAATLLLADFPGERTVAKLRRQASDASPKARVCVAHAIGFLQTVELLDVLESLLTDQDRQVHSAASRSLLSFSPKQAGVATVFRKQIDNAEFHPLFLNALAHEDPAAWLKPLLKVIADQPRPNNWSGGQVPAFTAWIIAWNYLLDQTADSIRSGSFDHVLDAMEHGYETGSSEPTSLYAFMVERGLTDRAKRYRESVKSRTRWNIDTYFNRADANPSQFLYKR